MLLCDYPDMELCDFLEFGWPTNYMLPTAPLPQRSHRNHPSATAYPDHVQAYLAENAQRGALLGPFTEPPFHPFTHSSPLMSRPKRNSDKRRIIHDLSWPPGGSVNDKIPRDMYMGIHYNFGYPPSMTLSISLLSMDLGVSCTPQT